ncbi:hypothetical protein ACVWXO_009617 [Bradyrhizobium sp. LM2.7]
MVKAEIERAGQHRAWEFVFGRAVAAAAGIDDVDQHLCIDAALDAHRDRLRRDHQRCRRHQVVGEFGSLRHAGLVAGVEQLAEILQDRLDRLVGLLRAGHHDGERAVDRALDAAAHGRIDQRHSLRLEPFGDELRSAGTRGRQIDHDCRAVTAADAVLSERDCLDDVWCRQADEHDIGARGDVGRRVAE